MPSLPEAHLELQAGLRAAVVALVSAAWTRLPGHGEKDAESFIEQASTVVIAGQARAVALTDAYLARALGRGPLGLNGSDLTGPAVRNGATAAEEWRRPFVTLWSALGDQKPYDDAVRSALSRARGMASMDVQLSHRAAYGAAAQADPQIRGYQRVADASACEFCRTVNGAFVKSASAMALHNGCGCGLRPVLYDAPPSPLPDTVAEHEHGEMGLVLAAPGQHFTSLADFT